jgi:hypothetical protein
MLEQQYSLLRIPGLQGGDLGFLGAEGILVGDVSPEPDGFWWCNGHELRISPDPKRSMGK